MNHTKRNNVRNRQKMSYFVMLCAKVWREMQLREDEQARKERARELELKEKELEIRQRQLELEKQKVTLRETLPQGSTVELTCYYDERVEDKVRSLLQGAHLALPPNDSFERELHLPPEPQSLPEFRKPRKLPSINGLRSRIISRHKLEDEASSFGSGASAD